MSEIKLLRKQKGFTQAQLAEKTGLSISLIQKYECGAKDITKAQFITITKLCLVLECEPEDIIS